MGGDGGRKMEELKWITPLGEPDYDQKLRGLPGASWPQFMLNDPVADELWPNLVRDFPAFQFAALASDGSPVAMANSIPFYWPNPVEQLPEEGWDWVLRRGVEGAKEGLHPNMVSAIQVAIAPNHRGTGLSKKMLLHMRQIAADHGFAKLVAPVRPSHKAYYPNMSMEKYITWTHEDGMLVDPWLRVHLGAGGRVIKVCHRSMTISGSLDQWRAWTGLLMDQAGEQVVPGALVPVWVDLITGRATYVEPNVWVLHKLG